MRVSIIIPTLNASVYLEKLLSMLQIQEVKPLEVIIVDSSSEDNTIEIAKEIGAKTVVIPRQTFNHGKTRNIAAAEANGEILVFMTQDALPINEKLLSNLIAPLQMSYIAATFGRHIPRSDASPLEVTARQFNYPDKASIKEIGDIKKFGIRTFFFSNVCSAIKKKLFFEAGMFSEDIKTNEDMLIAAKLLLNGYSVAYVPEAMVIHSHNYSLLKQFRRYYNIGSSLRNNNWILRYARTEGEGIKLVKEQVNFALKQHKYLWIPYIFLEAMAKYAGYRIGLIAG